MVINSFALYTYDKGSYKQLKIVNRIKINQLEPELRLRFLEPPKRERCAVASVGVISIALYCLSFLRIFIDSFDILRHDKSIYKQLKIVNRIKIYQLEPELRLRFLEPPKRERCAVVSTGVISITLYCLSFL